MLEKIHALLEKEQLDAILVASGYHVRYFSGFTGGAGYLYLSKSQQVILTDSRYTLQATEEGTGFTVWEISRAEGYPEKLLKLVERDQVKRLGFEDDVMIFRTVERFQEKLKPVQEWVPLKDSLSRFRWVKTPEEISHLAQAEALGDEAFAYLLGELKPGLTELEVAARLEFYLKTHGAEGLSFDTIVASGLHSAMPHATPSHKKLERGDLITLDFGCRFGGYCSDMTRTVVLGKANEKQRELYQIVLEAQETGLSALRAGITGAQADKASRSVIEKAGYGEYFGHALGHSVGLEIHERPSLSPSEQTVLEPGMIETVEPGIYVPGFGGVRIEDMVVVTENGCQNLTHSPKELLEI